MKWEGFYMRRLQLEVQCHVQWTEWINAVVLAFLMKLFVAMDWPLPCLRRKKKLLGSASDLTIIMLLYDISCSPGYVVTNLWSASLTQSHVCAVKNVHFEFEFNFQRRYRPSYRKIFVVFCSPSHRTAIRTKLLPLKHFSIYRSIVTWRYTVWFSETVIKQATNK